MPKWSTRPTRNQKGAGTLETLLVCILVGILVGAVIPYYQKLQRDMKEATLQTGLANIRKGIELYHLFQGRYPSDLKVLVNTRYLIPIREDTFFSGEYLRNQTVDSEGDLLDPFGNRYRYDLKSGSVRSGTEGYKTW
ncbi:MAG: type II secretion system protein GspG [Candidatus Manganitrophaceae bacterium]